MYKYSVYTLEKHTADAVTRFEMTTFHLILIAWVEPRMEWGQSQCSMICYSYNTLAAKEKSTTADKCVVMKELNSAFTGLKRAVR